jgi:hypothetical protein
MYADLIEFIYIYHAFHEGIETSGEYFQALQNRNIGVKRGTRYVHQGQRVRRLSPTRQHLDRMTRIDGTDEQDNTD